MLGATRWALCAALLALAAARRADQDFEFDEDAAAEVMDNALSGADGGAGVGADAGDIEAGANARRPRLYIYDPHNALCRALLCAKREVCVLRHGGGGALCASKKDILRRGDVLVSGGAGGAPRRAGAEAEAGAEAGADDVFFEAAGDGASAPGRCVGCGRSAGGGFLCGSDNRTYSSLCRLDLHNCVRRPAPPVGLACRGFCPCTRVRTEWALSAHNEVLPERERARQRERERARQRERPRLRPRPSRRRLAQGGGGAGGGAGSETDCAFDKMADRLLDWFSVLMEQARAQPPPALGFPGGCKGEVRWMFAHLDLDGDGLLSASELYALRHDDRERCLRPFLSSCAGGAGEAGAGEGVSRGAWCACAGRGARPCRALARAHAGGAARGGYVPACDARGYYRPRQCHAALAVCWCVDAHGAELAGSRARGRVACPPRAPPHPSDDEDTDAAGSGDAELLY